MWVRLLIFYVANVANVANVICRILRRSFSRKSGTLASEFNLLLRSQMPTMRIYAKIAAEIRHFRRPSTENHTLTVILPGVRRRCPGTQASPPAKCPSLLKIHLPVIIGNTLPTNGKKM